MAGGLALRWEASEHPENCSPQRRAKEGWEGVTSKGRKGVDQGGLRCLGMGFTL